jgi:hypothetical protein
MITFAAKITNKYIFMNHYETVFILNPVLSDVQVKETVSKFEDFLTSRGAEMVSKEDWGLKKDGIRNPKQKSLVLPFIRIQSSRRSSYCF